jgi:trimeric autotransporter adhesin
MKMTTCRYTIILIGLLSTHHMLIAQSGNYFSGVSAGASNTTGDYNAFAGYGAGVNNTSGSLNTAFGFYAGASNQATSYNTSIGAYAGYFTSSSFGENVFVGYRSGFYNSNGFYNVFLGSNAGYTNNSGSYNIFIGAGTGYDNTSGLSNTFVGYASGANNTTASANTFLGNLSGFSNTTGSNNTFVGSGTGVSNTTGINNAILGSGAGYYVGTGSRNTLLGYYAGRNTTGSNNTIVGSEAGASNTSGINNSIVGSGAGYFLSTGSGNTLLGYYAGRKTTSGYHNVLVGLAAGENNTTGRENTFIGRVAGLGNTTGLANTALGFFAGPAAANLTNATAIGHRAYIRVSNAIVLGSVQGVNGATVTAKVGIGTNSPAYLLHVNGVAAKPGGGSWAVASDKRLKQKISPYKEGLSHIIQINPVWFEYNGKAGLPKDKRFVGVLAQDMQKIAPHTIGEFLYADSTGKQEKYLDYDANAVLYMLVNAVKEMNTKFQEKDAQIQQLQQELAELKRKAGGGSGSSEGAVASLGQNYPNPFMQSTVIPYHIPEGCTSAHLKIYSVSGQEVFSEELVQRGNGEIEISAQKLSAGSYIYQLIVDGKNVDSKKMLLPK